MSKDSKIKVYELARELRLSNKKMIKILNDLDIPATGHMSRLCRRTDVAYLIDMVKERKKDVGLR